MSDGELGGSCRRSFRFLEEGWRGCSWLSGSVLTFLVTWNWETTNPGVNTG